MFNRTSDAPKLDEIFQLLKGIRERLDDIEARMENMEASSDKENGTNDVTKLQSELKEKNDFIQSLVLSLIGHRPISSKDAVADYIRKKNATADGSAIKLPG